MSTKEENKAEVACTCPPDCCSSSEGEEDFWFLMKIIFSQWIVMGILAATIVVRLACLGEAEWTWCALLTSLLLLSSTPLLVGAHHHSSPHCSCSTSDTELEPTEEKATNHTKTEEESPEVTNTNEKSTTKKTKRKMTKSVKKRKTVKKSAKAPKSKPKSGGKKKSVKSSASESESGPAEEETRVQLDLEVPRLTPTLSSPR